jgi:hypothetical protein
VPNPTDTVSFTQVPIDYKDVHPENELSPNSTLLFISTDVNAVHP